MKRIIETYVVLKDKRDYSTQIELLLNQKIESRLKITKALETRKKDTYGGMSIEYRKDFCVMDIDEFDEITSILNSLLKEISISSDSYEKITRLKEIINYK